MSCSIPAFKGPATERSLRHHPPSLQWPKRGTQTHNTRFVQGPLPPFMKVCSCQYVGNLGEPKNKHKPYKPTHMAGQGGQGSPKGPKTTPQPMREDIISDCVVNACLCGAMKKSSWQPTPKVETPLRHRDRSRVRIGGTCGYRKCVQLCEPYTSASQSSTRLQPLKLRPCMSRSA